MVILSCVLFGNIWPKLAQLLHRRLLLRPPLLSQVPLPMLSVPVRLILATHYLASSNTHKVIRVRVQLVRSSC